MASSEGTLCPRRSPENRPTSPFNLPTFAFLFLWSPTPSPANPPLQKSKKKKKLFLNDFEIATSAAIYLFYSIWAPKGASRTIFGKARDFFRHPCLPKGLFQSLLGAHGARRAPLRLDNHWVIAIGAAFGRTSTNSFFICKNNTFSK